MAESVGELRLLHREMHRLWDARDRESAGELARHILVAWPGSQTDPIVPCTHATMGMVAFRADDFRVAAHHLGIAALPELREHVAINAAYVCNALVMVDLH